MSRCVRIRLGRAVLVLLGVCALVARPAFAAEEGAGTRAASFLTGGAAPAVLGMGGASLALGRDLQGASGNPAALGWVANPSLAASHASFADETSQEWLAAGSRLGASRTRVGLAALIRDEGTIEGRDAFGEPTGDVRAQDLALTLQLARPFGEHFAAGGAAHFVSQRIGKVGGSGFAFDAGAQLRFGMLSLALAGQDFGGIMAWDQQRWRMPASLGAGVALEHAASGLKFALDWSAPADYYRSVRAGAEWRWRDRVALRSGWRGELSAPAADRTGGPTFGAGVNLGACWFDYGYVLADNGTATHRVGVNLRREHATSAPPAAPAQP